MMIVMTGVTQDDDPWPRYGILAAAYAAHLREERPDIPIVAGTGLVFPTWCEELGVARAHAGVLDLIPVALRRWRAASGLSQRAAAAVLDVTAVQVARAESDPGRLKLSGVLHLLERAGYDLQVVGPDGPLHAAELRTDEALARTADGRRFRATGDVQRLTGVPRWMAERGQAHERRGPQWTSEVRPGRYPA